MGLGKEIAKGVLIGVIGEVIVIILSFLANHLGIIDLMTVQLPVWIFLAIIIILVPAAVMASRVRRPSERIILTAIADLTMLSENSLRSSLALNGEFFTEVFFLLQNLMLSVNHIRIVQDATTR